MSDDPRYQYTRPAGFLRLFCEWRGVVALCLAVVALGVHGLLAWDAYQVDRFNARAQQATATVTRIIGDEALVRYETPQGSFAKRVAGRQLAEGDQLQVYYTPDAPTEIRRAKRSDLPVTGWFQGFATVAGVVALWFGWGQGLRTVRVIQTWRYGTVDVVEVTRIEEGRPGKYGIPARLHWQRSDGTFGHSRWHELPHLAQWQSGDQTDIYVWRAHSVWRDDVGPRPVGSSFIPSVSRSGQQSGGD